MYRIFIKWYRLRMTDTTMDRVQRGAELLDRTYPGWDDSVDLSNLQLASTCRCILGQAFGDYTHGLFRTGITHLPLELGAEHPRMVNIGAIRHGFLAESALDPDYDGEKMDKQYVVLTEAWREHILERRTQRLVVEEPALVSV